MGWFRRKPKSAPPSRAEMLKARPAPHPAVTEREADDGLELRLAMPKGRLGRVLSREPDVPVERRFALDGLGAEVWRMMAEKLTVRAMIERFAEAHQLELREAEVSILAYLRMLSSRGIMTLEGPDEFPEPVTGGNS